MTDCRLSADQPADDLRCQSRTPLTKPQRSTVACTVVFAGSSPALTQKGGVISVIYIYILFLYIYFICTIHHVSWEEGKKHNIQSVPCSFFFFLSRNRWKGRPDNLIRYKTGWRRGDFELFLPPFLFLLMLNGFQNGLPEGIAEQVGRIAWRNAFGVNPSGINFTADELFSTRTKVQVDTMRRIDEILTESTWLAQSAQW